MEDAVAAAAAAAAAADVAAADILWQVAEQFEIPGKEGLDFFEFTLDFLLGGRNAVFHFAFSTEYTLLLTGDYRESRL